MRRSRRRDRPAKNSRKSIWYWSDSLPLWMLKRRKDFSYEKSYVFMFYEDLKNGLFPYIRRNNALQVEPKEAEDFVAHTLDEESYDVASAMWRFMDNGVVYNLLMDGESAYEIVEYESDEPFYQFERIPNYSYIKILGQMFQYVPKERRNKKWLALKHIPSKNLFYIRLPYSLRRKMTKLLRELADISDELLMPAFARELMEQGIQPYSQFDGTWYRKKIKESMSKITRDTGWSGRSLFNEDTLEYYQLTRFLRFEAFQIKFRTIVLDGVNQALQRVPFKEIAPKIVLTKVPTEDTVKTAEEALASGNGTFKEVMAPFLHFS